MTKIIILRIVFVLIAAGGVFYGLLSPYLNGEMQAEKRKKSLQSSSTARTRAAERSQDATQRRKQISDSLKEIETRGRRKRMSLEAKIAQAGLQLSRTKYIVFSGISGAVLAVLLVGLGGKLIFAPVGLLIGGFGLPMWVLSFIRKRRMNKFINEFPNAVDVIVRGIKAGLPLGDCLRVIASESGEPVRSEFKLIVEQQTLGLSVSEAVEKITERVPVAEANFFAIVITIQQKAGGNLSETLSNLSRVLRDRKKMKGKIKAMSSEAKASAGIIGSLPFIVTVLVWLSSPNYISLLWTNTTGIVVMSIAGVWMFLGIMVMKKMISFDF